MGRKIRRVAGIDGRNTGAKLYFIGCHSQRLTQAQTIAKTWTIQSAESAAFYILGKFYGFLSAPWNGRKAKCWFGHSVVLLCSD